MQAVWIELPVKNVERALAFYQAVFGYPSSEIVDDGERRTTTLVNGSPEGQPGISLTETANFEPSNHGALVYINIGEDSIAHFERVAAAGGKQVTAKTSMGSAGSYALIEDTEGNLLALYSYP